MNTLFHLEFEHRLKKMLFVLRVLEKEWGHVILFVTTHGNFVILFLKLVPSLCMSDVAYEMRHTPLRYVREA